MQLARSRGGPHYFIETPLTLKGQGIRLVEVINAANRNLYWVTGRAMATLEAKYGRPMATVKKATAAAKSLENALEIITWSWDFASESLLD